MTTHGMTWDEDEGGARDENVWCSFPKNGVVHQATVKVFPWADSGAHAPGKVKLAVVFIEQLFRRAPCDDPKDLNTHRFLEKILGIPEFLDNALDLLIQEGLFKEKDGEGEEQDVVYDKHTDLVRNADALVEQLKDDPIMKIDEDSWDWLEGFNNTPAHQPIAWIADLTLDKLTSTTKDLTVYIDLALAVGPRGTEAIRVDTTSTFYAMVGAGTGGQLIQALTQFYYPAGQVAQVMQPGFLRGRLESFFIETKWPDPYDVTYSDLMQYPFDLPRRAAWKTATRQEWAAIIQERLKQAIVDFLPTLKQVFEDYLDNSSQLVREVQTLGDMLLTGGEGQKLPFWKILEVEAELCKLYGDLVRSEREAHQGTAEILEKLGERVRASRAHGSSSHAHMGLLDEEVRGPKPGQVVRAMADKSYSNLEAKLTEALQKGGTTNAERLTVIKKALTADSVLTKAVFFSAKGQRVTPYLSQSGADFLALLHGERHLGGLYLGLSLAYDEEEGGVPQGLKSFTYDDKETRHTFDFEWDQLDPLNNLILKLRGEEVGTEFQKYDESTLYHDGDMIRHVTELYGRKFECIGYPRSVPIEEGLSFRGFMLKIAKIQKLAVGLGGDEQKGAYAMIDDMMQRAYRAAAAAGKRCVYGPSPADKKLGAWLGSEESVVMELLETLEQMKDVATFRRRMGGMFSKKAPAAALHGFALAGQTKPTAPGGGKQLTPQDKRKAAKAALEAVKKTAGSPGGGGGRQPTKPGAGSPSNKRPNRSVEKGVFVYQDGKHSIGEQSAADHPEMTHISQRRQKASAQAKSLLPPSLEGERRPACDRQAHAPLEERRRLSRPPVTLMAHPCTGQRQRDWCRPCRLLVRHTPPTRREATQSTSMTWRSVSHLKARA